jgi:hypothetical protein
MRNSRFKFILSALIFIVSPTALFCQPQIQWQKCSGGSQDDALYSLIKTQDSAFIAIGYTTSTDGDVSGSHGNSDLWVIKMNGSGKILWQKCFGGSRNDYGFGVSQTFDGGFIVCGSTSSSDGQVTGKNISDSSDDFWVVKIDSNGSLQWESHYGGSGQDDAFSVIQTSDSGYAVVGYTGSTDGNVVGKHGYIDGWIIKLDSKGSLQWQRCIGGSSDGTFLRSIIQTSDGGYLGFGNTEAHDGDIVGNHDNHGTSDIFAVKLDSSGTIKWLKCYGGSGNEDLGKAIQTNDQGFIIVGSTIHSIDGDVSGNHNESTVDGWVVKLDSIGKIQWQKCIGGSENDELYSITRDPSDSGFCVAGFTFSNDGNVSAKHGGTDSSDIWVAKLSSSGVIEWQKCLGGSRDDYGESILETPDHSFMVVGYTASSDGDVSGYHGGSYDGWVVKLAAVNSVQEFNVPESFPLSTYPNPTSNSIILAYNLPSSSPVEITIYSITGERMKDIRETSQESGHHEMQIDLGEFPDGLYIVSISACGMTARRMVEVVK